MTASEGRTDNDAETCCKSTALLRAPAFRMQRYMIAHEKTRYIPIPPSTSTCPHQIKAVCSPLRRPPTSVTLPRLLIKRMLKEGNSTDTRHDVVEHQSTHFNVGVGSSSRAATKVYATTAEAIANFKPTHREVISGIAPHVFNERKRRRSQRRASVPTRSYLCEASGEKRPSPLRGTTVSTGEEFSIYLDPHRSKENIETSSICAFTSGAANVQAQETAHNNTIEKIDSDDLTLWKYLRIDTHLFKLKTFAVKLKHTRTR